MGLVKVENIKVYAYHGCLEEETIIGSDYLVTIVVDADLRPSAQTDDLQDTVDYVFLNRVVKEEMAIPSKLLEHVAGRILNRFFNENHQITNAKISISKINPPIGGDVEKVTIVVSEKRKI